MKSEEVNLYQAIHSLLDVKYESPILQNAIDEIRAYFEVNNIYDLTREKRKLHEREYDDIKNFIIGAVNEFVELPNLLSYDYKKSLGNEYCSKCEFAEYVTHPFGEFYLCRKRGKPYCDKSKELCNGRKADKLDSFFEGLIQNYAKDFLYNKCSKELFNTFLLMFKMQKDPNERYRAGFHRYKDFVMNMTMTEIKEIYKERIKKLARL